MLWYEVAGKVLYYITLPIVKVLLLVFYLLRVVLSPFIYIAQVLVQLCLIPYDLAARFEAVWYFIGCAILLGAVLALLLHAIFRALVLILSLDRKPIPNDVPAKGHDVKSYRKTRERKKEKAKREQQEIDARAKALANSPLLKQALKQMSRDPPQDYGSPTGRTPRPSLLDQTIIEHSGEEDS